MHIAAASDDAITVGEHSCTYARVCVRGRESVRRGTLLLIDLGVNVYFVVAARLPADLSVAHSSERARQPAWVGNPGVVPLQRDA